MTHKYFTEEININKDKINQLLQLKFIPHRYFSVKIHSNKLPPTKQ